MKIAVLGAKGFVGNKTANYLSKKHEVTYVTRNLVNLLDPISVQDFLKQNLFDVVINCANTMTDNISFDDARNNLGIFINFYHNSQYFGKFINTGSGAELDRDYDLWLTDEALLFSRMPKDSYGWSKNIQSRLCYYKDNFYTIRIFNCFGQGEISTRIFPRCLNSNMLEITNDRYFDYFSIQDLCKVVDHCINNDWKEKDVNAVYEDKIKISQAIELFCKTNGLDSNFKVLSVGGNNYTGNSERISSLKINLDGLEKGFKNYLTK
jgi:nucleoside-diphosphate-sugar epimerase